MKHAESCCSMKGLLSFHIPRLLHKNKRMCGDEIAEETGKKRGAKLTPGTAYPALKELKKKGLVKSEKSGRKVHYSLMEEGRSGCMGACAQFCNAFGDIFREFRKK